MENFVVNAAPVVGALIVCAIAWIDVRRAYRKAAATRAEEAAAAE
jgi:hypothetical protein